MNFENAVFRRTLSLNLRKKLRITLAGMSFENDFTDTVRGNLYPALTVTPASREKVADGIYSVSGSVRRLICEHFPYAEYAFSLKRLSGRAGFSFLDKSENVMVDVFAESVPDGYKILYSVNGSETLTDIKIPPCAELVSFGTRGQFVDVYFTVNGHFTLSGSVEIPALGSACDYPFPFKALLFCEAQSFETDLVEVYLDNGSALADMKPVRFIDGSTMLVNGRVFFTMSSRLASGGYQSVISWLPGTADFRLEGAIFFDVNGRGTLSGDVASCVFYDKENAEYLIWMCAFSSGHILAHGKTDGDILHGISIIDVTTMEPKENATEKDFAPLEGDEDPDFYFDKSRNKWYLSVCRVRRFGERKTYSYVKFESDNPFTGYRFCAATDCTGETGGQTTELDGRRFFMCGAEFAETSLYRIYDADNLKLITTAKYDYPDGGFRGWGTLVPVKCGNRQRVYQLTFDRVLSSDFNWSYGNLHIFEAIDEVLL